MKENAKYIIDFDAVMDFVTAQDKSRTTNSEITEIYAQDEETNEMSLVNKQLREVKNCGDSSTFSFRYDLVKSFINILDEISVDENEGYTILQQIAINSLINKGIIKEKSE